MNKFFKILGRHYQNSYVGTMDGKIIEIYRDYHSPIKTAEVDKEQLESMVWIWSSNPSQYEEVTQEHFEDVAEIKEAAHDAFNLGVARSLSTKEDHAEVYAQLQKDHPLWD